MPKRHAVPQKKKPAVKRRRARSPKHLLRPAIVILVVSLITLGLENAGWLRGFETAALDTWVRLKATSQVNEVIIVGITNEDYQDKSLFANTSPLKPEKLGALVDAVAKGEPSVIGVDIDTSDPGFSKMRAPDSPPVVWAVEAPANAEGKNDGLMALGGSVSVGDDRVGIAALPIDSDGVVRSFRRVFDTAHGRVQSFPRAVVTQYTKRGEGVGENHQSAADEHDTHDLVLNFTGDRYGYGRLTARQVLELSDSEAWSSSGPLKHKIVLIGGLYRAARDEYATPLGVMAGVELMAQSIASELRGGGIRHANELLMLLLEIVGGVGLVLLHRSVSLGRAMLLSLVGIPVLALASSFFAFSSLAYWANFVPILVSVLIHELYDHSREHVRMYETLKRLGKLEEPD